MAKHLAENRLRGQVTRNLVMGFADPSSE